eukprot:4414662-Prymnesium_polylepis.1
MAIGFHWYASCFTITARDRESCLTLIIIFEHNEVEDHVRSQPAGSVTSVSLAGGGGDPPPRGRSGLSSSGLD